MWTEYHRHDQEILQGVLRVRREADEYQADLRDVQEAPRPFQVFALRECQCHLEERDIPSSEDRLCPESEYRMHYD